MSIFADMAKVPKIRSLHIFAISPEKHGGWSWFFLPADEHESFLQVDSVNLGVCSQACPTYIKWQVWNIFAISKESMKDEVDFLSSDKHKMFLNLNYPK